MAKGVTRRICGGWELAGLISLLASVAILPPPAFGDERGRTPPSSSASSDMPNSENGRYAFHAAPDGVLRLDRTRGEVSTCTKQVAGWTCYMVADERAALESEIARLAAENGRLKDALFANKLPLPAPKSAGTANGQAGAGKTQDASKDQKGGPEVDDYSIKISGPGIDKLKAFAQQAWKRISGAFNLPR